MRVKLVPMTRELFHELFQGFQYDPAIFADMALYEKARSTPYSREATDALWDKRKAKPDLMTFAVMNEGKIIGETVLKNIDRERKQCEIGIHLIDDSVKGRGLGTEAERLAIEYAFGVLGMNTVLADTIIKNARSRHILEKLGFTRVCEKEGFIFYKLGKENYYADSTDR